MHALVIISCIFFFFSHRPRPPFEVVLYTWVYIYTLSHRFCCFFPHFQSTPQHLHSIFIWDITTCICVGASSGPFFVRGRWRQTWSPPCWLWLLCHGSQRQLPRWLTPSSQYPWSPKTRASSSMFSLVIWPFFSICSSPTCGCPDQRL